MAIFTRSMERKVVALPGPPPVTAAGDDEGFRIYHEAVHEAQ